MDEQWMNAGSILISAQETIVRAAGGEFHPERHFLASFCRYPVSISPVSLRMPAVEDRVWDYVFRKFPVIGAIALVIVVVGCVYTVATNATNILTLLPAA